MHTLRILRALVAHESAWLNRGGREDLWPGLLDTDARDGSGDDELLDLLGAFEDVEDL